MKKKRLKTINIAAAVIFAAALILNIQSDFHEGTGLFGLAAIGQGTGTGTGSGSGSGSGANWYAKAITCSCHDSVGVKHDYGSKLVCRTGGTAYCKPKDCFPPKPSYCAD